MRVNIDGRRKLYFAPDRVMKEKPYKFIQEVEGGEKELLAGNPSAY